MNHTTTPTEIGKHVRRLCARIGVTSDAVRLPVCRDARAVPNECFANVARKIAAEGGSIQYGWLIWEWPHVFIEAEFHAVWRTPMGELVEVSNPGNGETEILFVPDTQRTFSGRQVDNVRLAIRDDPTVHDFLASAAGIFAAMNQGNRADQLGAVRVPTSEIVPIVARLKVAKEMIERNLRATDLCACGSGRRYKRCHGVHHS